MSEVCTTETGERICDISDLFDIGFGQTLTVTIHITFIVVTALGHEKDVDGSFD